VETKIITKTKKVSFETVKERNKSVIHKEFVPVGKTVNSEFYIQVLDRLLE
jgi:hypothetical protein